MKDDITISFDPEHAKPLEDAAEHLRGIDLRENLEGELKRTTYRVNYDGDEPVPEPGSKRLDGATKAELMTRESEKS